MKQIQQITSDAYQTQRLILDDGSVLTLTLRFIPLQYGWFIDNLVWRDFQITKLRITNSPNMLYQWRNLLNFGLACFSKESREPSQSQDFSSGASILYILSESEVEEYTEFLRGQVSS